MAQLLIYNKTHWMDDSDAYATAQVRIDDDTKLTTDEKIKKKEIFALTYNGRYQIGDIIHVQEDGFHDRQGCWSAKEAASFLVVNIPGTRKQWDYLAVPIKADIKYPDAITARSRYRVDVNSMTFKDQRATVDDISKTGLYDKVSQSTVIAK